MKGQTKVKNLPKVVHRIQEDTTLSAHQSTISRKMVADTMYHTQFQKTTLDPASSKEQSEASA